MPDTLFSHVKKLFFILKLIYTNKNLSITDIVIRSGFNRSQVYTLLRVLEELGLIKKERIKAVPPRTIVSITNKGMLFVKCIEQYIGLNSLTD
jgi:predicted transcriptional regulator